VDLLHALDNRLGGRENEGNGSRAHNDELSGQLLRPSITKTALARRNKLAHVH
jgi:hypothetical protein